MQIRSKLVISLFPLLGVVACGDDDSSTGGVPSNKKVGDLSDQEAKSLCNSFKKKLAKAGDTQRELACVTTGLTVSLGNKDTCEMTAAQCRDMPPADTGAEIDCEDTGGEAGGVPEGCDEVTVGEMTACLDASLALVNSFAGKISCSSSLSDFSEFAMIEPPKECTKLGDQCGNFIGDN